MSAANVVKCVAAVRQHVLWDDRKAWAQARAVRAMTVRVGHPYWGGTSKWAL